MAKNHYNYRIVNIKTKEFYIGVRSCSCNIEDDPYMGSSSIWTKLYIKEHASDLQKIIIKVYNSRREANAGEVELLLEEFKNPLCINKYFDYTPDMTGTKQSPEWIAKRIKYGEANGMYGKHHTEESKAKIRSKLTGRKLSEETKAKIGVYQRTKVVSDDTKAKMSKSKSKIRLITNTITGESVEMSITDFCKEHPECNPNSMRKAADKGYIYKKTYRITEALL